MPIRQARKVNRYSYPFIYVFTCRLFRFKYKEDRTIQQAEREEKARKLEERDKLRKELLSSGKKLHESNTQFIDNIVTNWKATQKVKKDRQIRDLQFELSLLKKEELINTINRNHYGKDQAEGIVQFEKIMKRNGIGASEDGGGPPLSVSYEDPAVFNKKIEETAKAQWPSNEEVSDFVTQLKERTQEKRAARYEKTRRRRRAAVGRQQQEQSLASGDDDDEGEEK